jgi:hypothetical protein
MMFVLRYWKQMVYAAVLVAVAKGGYDFAANKYELELAVWQREAATSVAKANELAGELEMRQLELAATIAERDAVRKQKQQVLTKEVVRDVIKYVKSPDAGKCELTASFVRIHNSSASGVPEATVTTTASDGTTRRFTDSDLILVTTENYAACHRNTNKLVAWQDWWASTKNVVTHKQD